LLSILIMQSKIDQHSASAPGSGHDRFIPQRRSLAKSALQLTMDKVDPKDAALADAEMQIAWLDKLKTALFDPLDGKNDRVLSMAAHCAGQSQSPRPLRCPLRRAVAATASALRDARGQPELILDLPNFENVR
jgi:hypothetical protein